MNKKRYLSQSARDAQGSESERYCDYLEETALRYRDIYLEMDRPEKAREMMTRSYGQALMGNDGD
jgi:hypothetical protein